MALIRIGISSWADKTLIESGFFPKKVKTASDRLRYYSGLFDLAEIDSSFYRMPLRSNIDLWLASTPASFVFNVKAFRLFTRHPTPAAAIPVAIRNKHGDAVPKAGGVNMDKLPEPVVRDIWSAFSAAVEPVKAAGKLGVLLFQFPPWFRHGRGNLDHLLRCKAALPQHQLAVEFRESNWLSEENRESTLRFLRENGLALVCVDEPQGFKSSVPPIAEATARVAVVRFHGRNAENWQGGGPATGERFRYLYNEDELREWLPKLRKLAAEVDELYVVFKNKYRDYSPTNALQMKAMLGV